MTTWLELHQEMPRHKKTLALARLLRVDRRYAIGLMIDLWTWGLDNADREGSLTGMTKEDIALALDWPTKKAAELLKALIDAGWLEQHGETYVLHDWSDYTGKLSDKRELKRQQDRDRQRKRREKLRDNPSKSDDDKRDGHAECGATSHEYHNDVTRDITHKSRVNHATNSTVPYSTIDNPLTPTGDDVTKSPYETTKGGTPEQARDFERVARAYTEQVDPMPASKDCDLLFRLTAKHGADSVLDAIRETARSGGHSAAYLRKVLDARARDSARASPIDDNLEDL